MKKSQGPQESSEHTLRTSAARGAGRQEGGLGVHKGKAVWRKEIRIFLPANGCLRKVSYFLLLPSAILTPAINSGDFLLFTFAFFMQGVSKSCL